MLSMQTRPTMQTLLDALALGSDKPNTTAITFLQTGSAPIEISRAMFRTEVQKAAAALQQLGVQSHNLVIIAQLQSLESIYAFWGALWLGAVPSMMSPLTEKLDPDIYTANMQHLITHSKARLVLTSDKFAPTLGEMLDAPVHGSLSDMNPTAIPPLYAADPDEIAFLQHSSGTTGLQKGVALAHMAVLNQLASYSESLELNADDVIVSWLPLYHDMGLIAGFLLPLVQGVPLVLMSPFDWVGHPAMLLRAIHDYHGTLCWLPNFAYNHCARRIRQRDSEGLSLRTMRAFINCSEPVHHASHQQFLDRFADTGITANQLAVSYAMAENTFAVTQTPPGAGTNLDVVDRDALENRQYAAPCSPERPTAQTNVSCGQTIPGVEVNVLDEARHVLDERHVGELAVRSDFMLSGYYKRPDLDATTWHDGWYLTGDMGYIADGEVYIVGRKKDLIINAGKNVYPQDIEAIVNTVPGVYPGRVVVFGVEDEREGTELIAVVAETEADDERIRKNIAKEIRQRVTQQTTVTVSFVHIVEPRWLIKTSSGKIARNANRDKWLRERGGI